MIIIVTPSSVNTEGLYAPIVAAPRLLLDEKAIWNKCSFQY